MQQLDPSDPKKWGLQKKHPKNAKRHIFIGGERVLFPFDGGHGLNMLESKSGCFFAPKIRIRFLIWDPVFVSAVEFFQNGSDFDDDNLFVLQLRSSTFV